MKLMHNKAQTLFGVPGKKELVLLWVLGLGGLLVSLVIFFSIAPGAHVVTRVDRDEARQIAVTFLGDMGIGGLAEMSSVETMSTSSAHFLYLDERFDSWEEIERAQAGLALGHWVFQWEDAGLFDAAGANNYRVSVDFNGRVVSYRHSGIEGQDEANPDKAEAETLGRQALAAAGIDPDGWELEEVASHTVEERTDSMITWASRGGDEELVSRKITVALQGGVVENFRVRPGLPDRYAETVAKHERQTTMIRGFPRSVSSFLLLILLCVLFIRRYHQGELGVGRGAVLMLGFTALYLLVFSLYLPMIFANTTIPVFNLAQTKLFLGVTIVAFSVGGAGLMVVTG